MKHILFIIKTPNKKELQQVVPTHPSDIDFKDFMNVLNIILKIILVLLKIMLQLDHA